MTITELSIFVQDKAGKLTEISKLMGSQDLNIRGFMISDTAEGYGIFRLITDNIEESLMILKNNGYTVSEKDVLAVKITDQPGALANTLDLFSKNGINIEYLYAVANSVIVFKLDDPVKAAHIIKEQNIKLITNVLEI